MTYYYGLMVNELDGSIENLEGNFEYKPSHESCGFSFAKWFTDKEERDKCSIYMTEQIKK